MRHSWVFVPFVLLFFSCAGKLPPATADRPDLSAVLAKAKHARTGFASIKARARVVDKVLAGENCF